MLRVAINGFGRIGRTTLKVGWDRKGVEFVAINDLTDPAILAHLLKYDSVFRTWPHSIKAKKHSLVIDGKEIPVYTQKDPAMIPWKDHKVDVVIESTGFFTDKDSASKHLQGGAKKVVISAPAKGTPTYLMGVNHKAYKKSERVVNNASCTTNSIAPVVQVMMQAFGVEKALMTTIHSVTAGQNIVDGLPERDKPDMRRARSALVNMVPTSTGAAKATTEVIPELKNKFDGISVRVPTLDVSLSDFTFVMKKKVTVEQVNAALTKASKDVRYRGIMGVTNEPLVSSDFIGSRYASVVDLEMTRVVDGDLVKVMAWYDNEWGYTERLIDMVLHVGKS